MGVFCNFESIFIAEKVANKLTTRSFADIILSISLFEAKEALVSHLFIKIPINKCREE